MRLRFAVVVALLVISPDDAVRSEAPDPGPPFRVETVAPGVYAVISLDPLGLANHANAVFIVNDADVVVVDTQFTLTRTRAVLAALRAITDKPVSAVVNTHWHDDHTFGNQVYQEAFPDAEIIAHAHTREDMASIGVENRARQVEGGPAAVAMFRDAVTTGTAMDKTPMSDDERAAYQSTAAIAAEYLADMPAFALALPTRTFDDVLTLTRGGRVIEIRHLGPCVTRGDAVVFLPQEGVLVAGDIVDNPLPFAYGCDVRGWIDALAKVRAMKPRVIVPGHGAVMQDDAQVILLAKLLSSVREQAEAAARRGATRDEATGSVAVDEFRDAIAGDSKMMRFLFDGFFVGAAAASAYDAASKE